MASAASDVENALRSNLANQIDQRRTNARVRPSVVCEAFIVGRRDLVIVNAPAEVLGRRLHETVNMPAISSGRSLSASSPC